jgi:hypothetical protein
MVTLSPSSVKMVMSLLSWLDAVIRESRTALKLLLIAVLSQEQGVAAQDEEIESIFAFPFLKVKTEELIFYLFGSI